MCLFISNNTSESSIIGTTSFSLLSQAAPEPYFGEQDMQAQSTGLQVSLTLILSIADYGHTY
jgi:hypothetical protein